MTDTISALKLRARIDAELEDECADKAQRIVDELLREQAAAEVIDDS